MEAKDTVMSDDDINGFAHYPDVNLLSEDNWSIDKMLEAQAEVSFQAGWRECMSIIETTVKEAQQTGGKEVVEWILKYRSETTREFIGFTLTMAAWEAKQKELKGY